MEKIIQLENKYTREQLYNILKSKNIGGCSRLKKHDLAKKIIDVLLNQSEDSINSDLIIASLVMKNQNKDSINLKFIRASSVMINQNRDIINLNLTIASLVLKNQNKDSIN